MYLASSLVKSTYKSAKSTTKYTYKAAKYTYKAAKYYVVSPDNSNNSNNIEGLSWSSYMILFKNPKGGLVLDKAYIFLGDIPEHFHAYYINFMNWSVSEDKLIYTGQIYDKIKKKMETMVEIDSLQVHLHIHVGDTPFETNYFTDNPTYFLHYFSNSDNKIYAAIKDQLTPSKVEILNFTDSCSMRSILTLRERAERVCDPRFFDYKHQIYGDNLDHVMFTGINISIL